MHPFTSVTAIAAPIDEPNVDTNQLCPTRFNKVPRGPKYAQVLFHDRRFEADGREKDFVLNREPYRRAQIIVADRNWGSGSSRESAVYALYEFGIRCVIASSFGDIHANNCYKNGLLPVVLSDAEVSDIRAQLHERPGATISVDLADQTLIDPAGRVHRFEIHPVRKKCLLEGLDDIARTHEYSERLAMFEDEYRAERPWLFGGA
ncbi:MAG: 3-isopropylmalate/(R)-2-methylmalate dehydratase small subunit [Betaproteobacteria bacterium]|jgi:3-isopropylmalate/(R)-2-methylmalate dehydratase small subunit|nr:3-isopropylmalate/(R)-2-methylmalate dehydratase small subunit [Betaproteobacteria bacterium]